MLVHLLVMIITLPVGNIQRGIIAGKLNGAIPAQTPNGTLKLRSIYLSIYGRKKFLGHKRKLFIC